VRATKAYIASFGTTGTLIASALFTLSVMSAIVAFHGFPGIDIQGPIGSVQVEQAQAPLPVDRHPAAPSAAKVAATQRAAAAARVKHAARRGHVRTADSPVAHATPVLHRRAATRQPAKPGSGSGAGLVTLPDTGTVTGALPPTPSLPSTGQVLPGSPVTVPDGKQLPISLPVDTSSVTNAVNDTVNGLIGQH
jgi:hypothetical protein